MKLAAHPFRIVWTGCCLAAVVTLAGMWAHSYHHQVSAASWLGSAGIVDASYWRGWVEMRFAQNTPYTDMSGVRTGITVVYFDGARPGIYPIPGWAWHNYSEPAQKYYLYLQVPFWFLIGIAMSIGAALWLPWRFSLRTMLIGMTLSAVLLGIAMWAAHR